MIMSKTINDLAGLLYSDRRAEVSETAPSKTATIFGTAAGNSADGTVPVVISDNVTQPDESDSTVVEIPTVPNVVEGDEVIVSLVGGELKTPYVSGVVGEGDRLNSAIETAGTIADEALSIAEATNQHFWSDSNGAHVTEVTQEEWSDSSGSKYQTGANSLWNSLGMLFRKGLTNLMALVVDDPDDEVLGTTGVAIYDGQANAAENIVASFTNSGVTLGKGDESHAELDYRSLRLVDKEGSEYFLVSDLRNEDGIATIESKWRGDGHTYYFSLHPSAVDTDYTVTVDGVEETSFRVKRTFTFELTNIPQADSEIVCTYSCDANTAKAYTAGLRNSGGSNGCMSFAEGLNNIASAMCSHAEGQLTTASGTASHAEGERTVASGVLSHAEGGGSIARGSWSHAEGADTLAVGRFSHTQGIGTCAYGDAATAIGQWNVKQDGKALVIGNGTSDTARSDALTVDWSGNVVTNGYVRAASLISSGAFQQNNGTVTLDATSKAAWLSALGLGDTGWRTIAGAAPTKTGHENGMRVRRIGNVVQFDMRAGGAWNAGTIGTSGTTISQVIPAGFRPLSFIQFDGSVPGANTTCYMQVNASSGAITIRCSASTYYYTFSATWLTEDDWPS